MKRFLIGVLLIAVLGCAGEPEGSTTESTETTATTTGEVAFEPAYPAEVSTETLSAEDKAQQETHKHGDGEEHTHTGEAKTKAGHGHPH